MYTTYKMMANCTNSIYLNKDLEELCEEYRKTDNVIKRNKIVAAMFCKTYPMIIDIQKKYYSLTNEQKVEHALFHLVRSIKYYNNKNVKFSSFFHTHLTNQMKSLLKSENSLKKAVFQNIVRTGNDSIMSWYTKNVPQKDYEKTERYILQSIRESQYLSTEEKEYLACILAGYTKVEQICNKLNLAARYPQKTKKTKKELTPEQLFKQQKYKNNQYVSSIKKSIREKIQKYGIEALCG